MATSLLIAESPHQLIPSLAVEIGLNEALFLQQLHWLIQNNECYYYEKRLWWYHSQIQWHKVFPYWCPRTITKIIKSLKQRNLITVKKLSCQIFEKNIDRMNWYSINHDEMDRISAKVALEKQKEFKEKQKELSKKPIKIKGKDLIKNIPESSTGHVESPLGNIYTYRNVDIAQSNEQDVPNVLNKIYKEDLDSSSKRENANAEPSFDFDLIFGWIINELIHSRDLTTDDKSLIKAALLDYTDSATHPRRSKAFHWCLVALEGAVGTNRRGNANREARDDLSKAVVKQLEIQTGVIQNKTKLTEQQIPKTTDQKLNDRSWVEGLEF